MINHPLKYSSVFSFDKEENPFLRKKKRSIAEHFKFSVEREVEKVYSLAYWLHVFKRNEEAVTVCDFLLQKDYDGDLGIWYHIEKAIGLKYVMEKQTARYPAAHFDYRKRISEAQNKNIQLRAKDEKTKASYQKLYEGLLNGQLIENELWNDDLVILFNRTEFYIGGHKGNCNLFWERYYLYLAEIRKYKKIN